MTADQRVRDVLREHGLRGTSQRLAILQLLGEVGVAAHGHDHRHDDTGPRAATGAGAAVGTDHEHGRRHGHLTVAEIHARLAEGGTDIDVTTVYRTLTTLVELGIVHAVADAAGATAYGLATRAHHHAVCRSCGTVSGIPSAELEDALAAVARATGFDPADATLTVHGRCAGCRP